MCIVAESLYLTLLFTGGALMTLELFPCFSIMNKLKLSAFAAMFTALSGNELHCYMNVRTGLTFAGCGLVLGTTERSHFGFSN